jgi:hypothetical protein
VGAGVVSSTEVRRDDYLAALEALRIAERLARFHPTLENIREVQRLSAASSAAFKACRRPTGIGNRP